MSYLSFSRQACDKILATRKMLFKDIEHLVTVRDDEVYIENLKNLFSVCELSSLPETAFFSAYYAERNSEYLGVTVSRADSSYQRIKGNSKDGGYHYRHVLTTPFDGNLLVLRTTPLSSKGNSVLNDGHLVKEFVYVLKGKVGILWSSKNGRKRFSELNVGDSVYIQSWVPHSFYSIEPNSDILVVDYS